MLSLESLQEHLKVVRERDGPSRHRAPKQFLFSPGLLSLQDVNLVGHKYQSQRGEDDEEDQESDQRFFIV